MAAPVTIILPDKTKQVIDLEFLPLVGHIVQDNNNEKYVVSSLIHYPWSSKDEPSAAIWLA